MPVRDSTQQEARTRTILRAAYGSAVALVLLAFFAACLHGIANWWQWGHNGFTGSSFSLAAINSLRFGIIGPARFYTGLTPPPVGEFYTHHPLLLHFHLVGAHWLLGRHEWVARLVPALYSFGTLALLFFVVRRLWGAATALAAIAIYTLTPLNLIFANMVDHEQGGIFFCLWFVYLYVRWRETNARRHLVLALVALTLAAQFDWPGYYLAFFLAGHALVVALRAGPPRLRWRREYTWVLATSLLVAVNVVGFFGWIAATMGGLHEMRASFQYRTDWPADYLPVVWHESLELHGPLLIALTAGWIVWLSVRLVRRRARARDLIPASLLLAQIVHSAAFSGSGRAHSFWIYYLSPALAIGGADLLMSGARWLRTLPQRIAEKVHIPKALTLGLATLAAAAILTGQAVFAWNQLQWGFASGSASFVQHHDQFEEILWARDLGRRYGRRDVQYLLSPSLGDLRIEWIYYLDAPVRWVPGMQFDPRDLVAGKHTVLLVDLAHVEGVAARRAVAELSRPYATSIWHRRFVAIDASVPGPHVEAFAIEQRRASVLWRWLVNPNRPPARWRPDPAGASVLGPGR